MQVSRLAVCLSLILLLFAPALFAQESQKPEEPSMPTASPVFTGFAVQNFSLFPDKKKFDSGINPVLLFPVGNKGLFLVEWELGYSIHREDGKTEREFEYGLEYLQFNQPFSRRFTGVFGKFLTPGMWNERLHPAWIKKTSDAPFTAGLLPGSGTGFMLRGAAPLGSNVNLTYSPFFTTAITNKYFDSERMTGGRVGTFFKREGLDLGVLVARTLQSERANIYGADFTYQLRSRALDFRGEYYRSAKGSAYWAEAAKLLKSGPRFVKRHLELAVRLEQAFVLAAEHHEAEEHHDDEMEKDHHDDSDMDKGDHHGEEPENGEHHTEDGEEGHHGSFPEINTNRLIGSVNYYIRDGVKLYFSYGHEILPGTGMNQNVWGFGLAFRFLK